MARYFTESIGDRMYEVVAQDETGLYRGGLVRFDGSNQDIKVCHWCEPVPRWIKLPEWPEPREVMTNSMDYLECLRRVDRNPIFMETPSELMEMPGTADEVIRSVLEQALPDGVWETGHGWTLGERLRAAGLKRRG